MGASLQSKSEIAQRQNYSRHHDSLSQSFPFFNVLKGGKLAKMKVFFSSQNTPCNIEKLETEEGAHA